MSGKIICTHIGARAHYLLPKALESQNKLEMLITDTWVRNSWLRKVFLRIPIRLVKSFSSRYSPEISKKRVQHFSLRFLIAEIAMRLKYKNDWSLIMARNQAFQKMALPLFLKLPANTVLGTSYTSLAIFESAAARGQKTILFQIDPGVKEENIVAELAAANASRFPSTWQKAPTIYWENWKKECRLSDIIMVNSEWSKQGLLEEGIEAGKIKIVDLPFQLNSHHHGYAKTYPLAFTKERPLRCLFLGTLTLRKGIHLVLEAAAMLTEKPVEFILVGNSEIEERLLNGSNVTYKGVATRAETDNFYREADVFLFPTLSDGFGLTQLEAMAWQVPVIASLFCGHVVKNNTNGITMTKNTAAQLAAILVQFVNNPLDLKLLSANCLATVTQYNTDRFATELAGL